MRRVLFDEDVPRQLRRDLPAFEIRTVQEEGWSSVKNGLLATRDTRLPRLQQVVGRIRDAVRDVAPGATIVIDDGE